MPWSRNFAYGYQLGSCEVDMMFEDLDKFIAENPGEVLVTGGWTDD